VGVFAACSVASAGDYSPGFLWRFNERGVDALIASPFPIPATYGTRLALELPEALQEPRQTGRSRTISDLFARAIMRTTARLEREFAGKYQEIGLEYVLLGNPGIVLCDKTEERTQP
jgi:hypothetical protein